MVEYTHEELTQLFRGLESDTVERKRSWASRIGIRKSICAFANDLPGNQIPGVIFVGVNDDGSFADIPIDDRLLSNLSGIKSDGAILPLPSITVQRMVIDGCEVAVVIVQPSPDAPLRYDGRVWVRVGPTVQMASRAEERRLEERHGWSDRSHDLRRSDAEISDLDLHYIETTYIPTAVPVDALRQNQRPLNQRLQTLRLAYRDRPTRGAMIAFGQNPQCWAPGARVQFVRFRGDSTSTPVIRQKAVVGQIQQVIREVDRLIKINTGVSSDFPPGSKEVRKADYPSAAIKQIAHNAIMHRSYERSHTPVRIHWFSDRVVIQSPGGLYGDVTPANINTGVTSYRNPLIAEIMFHLGFAQRFGLGLQVARDAMEANGNPSMEFNFAPTFVNVTLRSAQ